MDTIGERLRHERERLKLNQDDFAALGGIKKRALIHYEKGERSPDATFLAAIATAGADVLYILTGRGASDIAQAPAVSEGDRILLDNFHHAPAQVQAGVKTTLGAFAPATSSPHGGGRKKAA